MRHLFAALLLLSLPAAAQQPFTLQQVLSAPYALQLTAAPTGNRFAWIENAQGVRNIWTATPTDPARQLTHYTQDDAQDINQLAWSPDGQAIAYTYGAEDGADGHPANPAHLQRDTANVIIVQPLTPNAAAITIGEGHNPLFLPGGSQLLYIRNGQVWIATLALDEPNFADAAAPCAPPQNCSAEPAKRVVKRTKASIASPLPVPFTSQLIYDRGHASSLTLSPDGNTLAFISHRPTTDGPSHAFLALFNLDTHQLTFPAPSTGEDSAPTFSPDGKQIAWLRSPYTRQPEYTPHLTSPNPWSIQLLDLTANIPNCPHPEATPLNRPHPDPERSEGEGPRYFAGDGGHCGAQTVYSPQPNQPGSILPHIEDGEPKLFWATGDRILFYSEADGWNHLYSVDLKPGSLPVLLTPGNGEVEDATVAADGKEAFWASNIPETLRSYAGLSDCMGTILGLEAADIERRHLSSLDVAKDLAISRSVPGPSSAKNRLKEDFEKAIAADFLRKTDGQGIEVHPTFLSDGSLVALASDSFRPMHPVYVGKDGTLTDVKVDGSPKPYPARSLVFPEEIELTSADSARMALHAQIFLPGNTKADGKDPMPWCDEHMNRQSAKDVARRPAIIFVHGGPNRQMLLGYPGMDYYSNAYAMNQYLASRGFIVLSVNYRGGTGYGLRFREAAHYGPNGASEYNDVLAAQKYLASRPDVDPARIGIWGGSYGGYLTALALARNSNLFAAGVDFHGVHEWSLEGDPERWMADPTHATAAQKDAAAALAHASSPMADVDKWKSPVLLIHGDNDPEVNFAQTPILADALRARHVPVEELIFPDEVHGFLLHKDWLAAYTAAAAFFERTLKPNQ